MPHHSPLSSDPQSGNAFWIILLAIALLVALTITITKSGENTEQSGQRDRDRIQASDILRQVKSMEQAVQNMRIAGIPENDISFKNDVVAGYENYNCNVSWKTGDPGSPPDDDHPCEIFHVEGGGLSYKIPSPAWLDPGKKANALYGEWYFYANACIPDVGTGDAGCSGDARHAELIVALPWVTQDLCIELNRLSGVQNLSDPIRPPQISGSAYKAALDKFTGVFEESEVINNADDAFKGKATGCFQGDTSPAGGYHFYHVLIPR